MIHSVNHLPSTTLTMSGGIKIPDGIILLCKNFSSLKVNRLHRDVWVLARSHKAFKLNKEAYRFMLDCESRQSMIVTRKYLKDFRFIMLFVSLQCVYSKTAACYIVFLHY